MTRKEPITQGKLLRLAESQNFRCAYTGEELTPQTASLDHKVPLSQGGEHTIDNLHLVRQDVNRAKGAMDDADFIQMCLDIADHHRKKRKRNG